jgi:hypothetical protein
LTRKAPYKPALAKAGVEWHPSELYPRVGFIETNLARPAERVVAFYNQRGTAEQWIKEGKVAIKWTRLSSRTFAANTVRLQLHALAYNLGNFMQTLAMPEAAEPWSLTSLREMLIKIGAKVVSHGRYVTFQMAEVAVSRPMFAEILSLIAPLERRLRQHEQTTTAEARPGAGKEARFSASAAVNPLVRPLAVHAMRDLPLPKTSERAILAHNSPESGECRFDPPVTLESRSRLCYRLTSDSCVLRGP